MSREEEYFEPDVKRVKREGDENVVSKVNVVIWLKLRVSVWDYIE